MNSLISYAGRPHFIDWSMGTAELARELDMPERLIRRLRAKHAPETRKEVKVPTPPKVQLPEPVPGMRLPCKEVQVSPWMQALGMALLEGLTLSKAAAKAGMSNRQAYHLSTSSKNLYAWMKNRQAELDYWRTGYLRERDQLKTFLAEWTKPTRGAELAVAQLAVALSLWCGEREEISMVWSTNSMAKALLAGGCELKTGRCKLRWLTGRNWITADVARRVGELVEKLRRRRANARDAAEE